MLKQDITYVDFNGIERTESFYFNLTKTELAELDIDAGGTLRQRLMRLMETQDNFGMAKFFKELIVKAYGEKSDDGRYFDKGEDNAYGKRFTRSNAFDKFFTELLSDPSGNKAEAFLYGVVPKDVADQAKANTTPKISVGDDDVIAP
ncbi:MAG: hypothetical protein J6U54_03145 [Clostridiales bacterium]|nr:hypothetical protein [Clostridiales bacterium]